MDGRSYSSMHQSSRMPAGNSTIYSRPQQRYEQAYVSGMYLNQVHGQQRAARVPMTAAAAAAGRGGVRGVVRGRAVPVGPGYPLPPQVASMAASIPGASQAASVQGPPNPYHPSRVLRPTGRGQRGSLRAPLRAYTSQPQATEDFSEDLEHMSAIAGQRSAEDFSNDIHVVADGSVQSVQPSCPVEGTSQKINPFEVVKNMLVGMVKKKQYNMGNNSEVSMNDTYALAAAENATHVIPAAPKREVHISAAPLLYRRPSQPSNSVRQDVEGDDDDVPYSPTSEDIVIKDVEDSLPSPTSDSPTGDMTPGPNMDNPILQALYNSQVSPKEHHHSPSALDLLRAEDSDQEEEELTSSELKNILEQVKSGDSPDNPDMTGPATDAEPYHMHHASGGQDASAANRNANAVLAANIPITPKLTNLLDQIFPKISQSLIDRKRKQGGEPDNNGMVAAATSPDAKVPRLVGPQSRPMGPPQQPHLYMRSPGDMSARPPYPGARYPSPRLQLPMSPSRMPPQMTADRPRAPVYVGTDGGGGLGVRVRAPPGTSSQPAMEYRYRTPSLGTGARGHPRGPRMRIMYQPGPRMYRMQRPPPPQGYRPMRPRFV